MKHFYSQIKNFINIALFLGIFMQSYIGNSQTSLAAGDLIFTGFDSTQTPANGDVYSFVLLKDIDPGTIISFTDRGYFGAGVWQAAGGTEATVTWVSGTFIPLGTEIMIKGLTASVYNTTTSSLVTNGTVTLKEGTPANGLSLANVGDQIIAFQGGTGIPQSTGVTFIAGLTFFYCTSDGTTQAAWDAAACADGPNSSVLPPNLVGGTSAFFVGTVSGNIIATSAKFTGTGPFGNAAAIRSAVMNQANWSLSNSATPLTMPSTAPFLGVPPTITTQPPNRTLCPGGNTTFTIAADNATSYQWQVNTGSGFTNLSNTAPYSNVTTASLSITGATASMNGYLYRSTVTGAGSVNTNSATLSVPNITISTLAQTDATCNGASNGTASISASGGIAPLSYSWSPYGGSGASATGLSAQTYTVTVTDNITCAKTHTITIGQPTLAASTPSISGQPSSTAACSGSNAGFSVVASNTASYQWQVDNGGGFNNISNGGTSPSYSGANTANLSIGSVTPAMNGYAYRVVLTSSCSNTIASNGLSLLSVNSFPVAAATPASKTICSGTAPNIALTSSPTGATFAWTVSTTSGSVSGASAGSGTSINQNLTGNGTVTYTVTPTLNGCPGSPIAVVITVDPLATATATPASQSICSGSPTNIVLTSTPSGAAFAWTATVSSGTVTGFSDNSGTSIAQTLTGNGTVTYTVTPTLNGCPGSPIAVVVSVNAFPTAIATPASKTICSGVSPNIALTSLPVGATFAWTAALTNGTVTGFSDSSGTSLNQALTGNGVVTYTVTPTLNGCPGAPITVPITVLGVTSITAQPSNASICAGGSTTFSVTAANAASYQWQVDTGAGFNNVTNDAVYADAQTATLTISAAPGTMNGYVYRAIATGTCTTDTSASRTLTVNAIIANLSSTNVSCNGGANGTATVTPSGGTSPYTYAWSNGATTQSISGLIQGNYSVTIKDASLCETTQNFTITEPTALTLSQGTVNNVSCNGGSNGSATVLVSGGASGYSYSWSPSGGSGATASGLAEGIYTVTVTDANFCQAIQNFTITQPNAFTVTTSQNDILCNGAATGSASVAVSGATSPYSYSWAPFGGTDATATGLTAGTYIVTITDNKSCSTTRTFIITEPTALTASAGSVTNVNCYGEATGSATVNVIGGTGSYTYSWAPSGGTNATASGLTAGTYVVTVTDDNSCQTTQSFTITQPAAILAATTASTGVSCYGGSNGTASVNVSGGTPSYTYSWAPLGGSTSSISGRPGGNYTCTITDSKGCILIKNITISSPNIFGATYTKNDVSCNGGSNGSATITVNGATAPFSYTWTPSGGNGASASGLAAGNYTVIVQDANTCSYSVNVTIDEPPVLSVVPSKTDVLCNGGATGTATVTATGGTPGYTYLWSPSGGTAATATGLAAGNYSCLITDNNGCFFSQGFTISQPAILGATTSQINATCSTAGQASVSPFGGKTPYTYLWSPSGQTTATLTGLAAGNHSVLITDGNGCIVSKNFTITTTNTLTAVASQTDVLCNGDNTGSATVVPSGAPGPFTYVWSPSGGNASTASNLTAGNYSVTITSVNGCSIVKNFTITQPSAIVVTPSYINVTCNGGTNGSASVNVTGGTGGYTYVWSPSGGNTSTASGLSAGTYTVTIKDGNLCQTTQSFTLTEPNALVGTISKTDVSCNGGTNGSATVSTTGGTGAYTYVWAPTGGTAATASGLASGTYTVTITDTPGCSTTQSVTINQPAVLTATILKTDVLCNGGATGTATVTATGGTPNYTYLWSPSGGTAATATGLTIGNYSCLITDNNGCMFIQNVTISQPAILSATTSKIDATCSIGGQAAVNVTGGTTPYTYLWSPSGQTTATVTGLASGNHNVVITDANGCTINKNFIITTINTLTAVSSQTDVLCNGSNTGTATVVPSGAPGPFTYVWSPSGGNAATASNLTAGNYSVTITAANGCSIVKNFIITQPSAIVVTPSHLNVSCNGGTNGTASVNVTGGTGSYTYVWSPSGGTSATASGLSAGTYTVTIKDGNLCQTTQSFTITQPPVLAGIISKTDVSCNGGTNGSATVNVTGGTGAYTYVWAPTGGTAATASGLAAGTYTVTITDANSCTVTESVTINEPTSLTATITQTNVICIGEANGSATVNVIGGTGAYTYVWSPSGGTSAMATGLTAGNYTVTIKDANGCTLTKSITILTNPDTTAPVPNVLNLSVITNYCAVLASQIPIPTATDSCAGIINATTTNPLNYTTEGNYVIAWSYNDGHGNIATQNQTIQVIASPLNQVTFSNAAYTFDGNGHTAQVANLPAGTTVAYSISPAGTSANGAVNAGVYTVTAVISPAASTPNCSPITLTAQLTINKAAQQITFGALPAKILGANNNFNLTATTTSGLPINYTFTYTSALPPATVSASGLVNMLRSGEILITANQSGNANYLPAAAVSQLLVIKNNDVTVTAITIDGQVYQNPSKEIRYLMGCNENNVNIAISNSTNAVIVPSANFTINPPKPGLYTQNVGITSEDGTTTTNYTIIVEKPFGFAAIVQQKFNNVLLVNNNPQTNGGYEFVAYQWFKNGQLIGTGQYYSAGDNLSNTLDPTAVYSVKMTTKGGQVLQTCNSTITLQNTFQAKLYPNPIETGKVITVEADYPAEELEKMQISLYSVTGQLIKTVRSSTVKTEIQLPAITESNMYLVVIETANIKKSFKVIVK